MSDVFFTIVLSYNLRSITDFFRNTVNTTKFDLNSLRYFAVPKCLNIKQVIGSLTSVTATFLKIICIALDMLTWLMTNLFIASVLIMIIEDPWNTFTYVMRCTIWYHLYNLKIVKNTHGEVLILVNL